MKKTLLSLGTIVSAVAPVAGVIACGSTSASLYTMSKYEVKELSKEIFKLLGESNPVNENDIISIKSVDDTNRKYVFNITRSGQLSPTSLTLSNLTKTGAALTLTNNSEVLKVTVVFNEDWTLNVIDTKFELLGSTETKNGEYSLADPEITMDKIFLNISKYAGLPFYKHKTLSDGTPIQVNTTSTVAKEKIFSSWTQLNDVKLDGDLNFKNKTFDINFNFVSFSNTLIVTGDSEALPLTSGTKSTIHLVGAFTYDETNATNPYSITAISVFSANKSAKVIKLDETASKDLAKKIITQLY